MPINAVRDAESPCLIRRFATFWHGGDLSAYEIACLLSFPFHGYELVVYSYEKVGNLPGGVRAADARDILPQDSINSFVVKGVPSLAHFTDYFRLVLFTQTDQVWVDTDIFLLNQFGKLECDASNLMGRETASSVCNAVLRLDRSDPKLSTMIAKVESLSTQQLGWGRRGRAC